MEHRSFFLRTCGPLAAAAGSLALLAFVHTSRGSDHQDTPEVELSPRADITDVYVFPAPSEGRVVLVLNSSSFLTPAQTPTAAFDPELLYQIKVDNTGDAVEDLVLQFTFEGDGANQVVRMTGPVAPPRIGMLNQLADAASTISGPINTVLGASSGVQLFAGARDDPFFIDLEQFFRIIPDRRPSTGPLSQIAATPSATAFRNPGIDYVRGFNVLSIVVELPESLLTEGGGSRLGVWETISR